MNSSLPRHARRLLSASLAVLLLAGNLLTGASLAAASGAPPAASSSGAPPGVSATASATIVGEIEASRTADSSTYQLSDGTRRAEIFTQPVHYKTAEGRWADIDPTLVPTGEYGEVRSKATSLAETFGSDEGSRAPVSVASDHWSLGMKLLGGELGDSFALGDQAIYPLAASDTQLAYESRRNGIKDTLVLASPDAPETFTFFVALDGLKLYAEPGTGGFALYDDATHAPAGRIEPLAVYDSAGGPDGASGVACGDASMTVANAAGGAYVTYHVPRAWLDDPARVYPVYVDPVVTFAGPDDTRNDTYVAKGDSAYHYSDNHLDASLFASGDLRRGLINLGLNSVPRGSTINSAVLQLYAWQNSSAGTSTTNVQPVVGTWGYNATWANSFGNGSIGVGSGGAATNIAGGANHYAYWDVTPVVQRWASGSLANSGFVVYSGNESGVCQHSFWSAEYTAYTSRQPHLVVDYTPPALTADAVPAAVHPGDTVRLTLHSTSRVVTQVQARVDSHLPSGATTTTAQFLFSATQPGAEWVSTPVDGGYLSYLKAVPGAGVAEPDLALCTTTARSDGRDLTFAYRIASGCGDVQNNRVVAIDPDWQSSWQDTGQSYGIVTDKISKWSAVSTATGTWHDESTSAEATAGAGRGTIALTWGAAPGASAYGVYLFDGNTYEQVATTTATSWSTAGKRLWPSDSAIASMSAGYTGNPFAAGTLDLRDDPRPLWAKTAGTAWDSMPAYALKVVASNSAGSVPLSQCPTITVALPGRTKHLADEPRHTLADLGRVGADDAGVQLDRGDMTLSATDLSIPGVGPAVHVARTYHSAVATATLASPGWRFDFERSIVASGDSATYVDETGDVHRFRLVAGAWVAPHGDTDLLSGSAGSGFTLMHKDRSATAFDSSGRLVSESDAFGNTAHYDWAADGSSLTIRSARDLPFLRERRIRVEIRNGEVVSATGHVSEGDPDRIVTYDARQASLAVTRFPATSAERTSVYRYDASGRIASVEVPGFQPSASGSAIWAVVYGANSVTLSDETGAGTPRAPVRCAWDGSGRATISSPSGTSTVTFDPLGDETSRSDENTTSVTTRAYDVEGDQISAVTPSGRTKTSVFDGRGNEVQSVDELGGTTTRQFAADECFSETDPRGAVTARSFDGATGALLSEEKSLDASGTRSHADYTYNTDGTLSRERRAVTPTLTAETDYGDYASCGRPQSTTKRGVELSPGVFRDLTSHESFDGFGDSTLVMDATGATVADNRYDEGGRISEATDASGTVAHTRYDVLDDVSRVWRTAPTTVTIAGWVEHTVTAAGDPLADTAKASDGTTVSVTTHTYDAAGREVASDNSAVPGTAVSGYDAQGNLAQVWNEGADTSSAVAAERTTYNADGEESAALLPGSANASAITSYTADGQVALASDPDGASVRYAYDAAGGMTSQTQRTDAGDATTTYVTDLAGRTVGEIDASGTRRGVTYDLNDNETGSSLGANPGTSTRVNSLGWPLERTDADGVVTTDTYDANGHVLAETVGAITTSHSYDACGRTTGTAVTGGSTLINTFDCFGDLVASSETSGSAVARSTECAYDGAGRIATEVHSVDGTTTLVRTHAYAPDGRDNVTETRRSGATITTTLDGRGQASSQYAVVGSASVDWSLNATDAAGRTTGLATRGIVPTRFTFNDAGQLQESHTGSATAAYSYSSLTGKLCGERFGFGFGGRAESNQYAFDMSGRLASATVGGVTTGYIYDSTSGALLSKQVAGQAATRLAYDSGATDQLVSAGARVFSSDALGRRVSSGTSADPHRVTYSWSGERLAHLSAPGLEAAYSYDAQGQRSSSVVTSGGVTTTIRYEYDGPSMLSLGASRSDGASWTIDYVYGDNGALLGGVYRSADSATPFTAETSVRGDVRELLDSSGAAFAFYGYDALGAPTAFDTSGTALVSATLAAEIGSRQPLRYASYAWDSESALYYCSARYYDPDVAAFISKDPDRFDGDRSAYQYCSGDPIDNIDPTGCDVWSYGENGDGFYEGLKDGELALVQYCLSRVGGAYVYGAKAKKGHEWDKGPLDCSGLTAAAYRVAHKVEPKTFPEIPDGSQNQHDASKSLGFDLSAKKLRISDLGFLHNGGKDSGKVHHVGIYIGKKTVVEARGRAWGVVKTALKEFNKRGADWHRARKR